MRKAIAVAEKAGVLTSEQIKTLSDYVDSVELTERLNKKRNLANEALFEEFLAVIDGVIKNNNEEIRIVKAFIEKDSGGYSVHINLNEDKLTYNIFGQGVTAKKAVDDFYSAYKVMRDFHKDKGLPFEEVKFKIIEI